MFGYGKHIVVIGYFGTRIFTKIAVIIDLPKFTNFWLIDGNINVDGIGYRHFLCSGCSIFITKPNFTKSFVYKKIFPNAKLIIVAIAPCVAFILKKLKGFTARLDKNAIL